MPPASDKAGRVVFIGNIPYGVPEEEIQELLGRVGQVVDFRIVTDRETGRPKGFGFAEFTEQDAASSAVRNLNDYEIQGRKLRVDWSNENGSGGGTGGDNAGMNGQGPVQASPQNSLPPLPAGTDLPPDITCPDQISKTLNTLPAPQLLDVISQMKNLVNQNPQRATELLVQSPQLSYAIFQSLLLLGLVETSVLQSVISNQPVAPPQPQPQQPVQAPMPAFPNYAQYNQPSHVPTPPMAHQPYQQPPPVVQQPQAAEQINQAELLQRVLTLTDEQINAFPPDARQQIMALRAQMGGAPQHTY
ncbi:RNA-binding domain-containing protein [Pseudovirgaria hyperparasitica]|uniref:RNA-binding domain-containing protein n=1 Tax=Pseudovirgaria hyperparasitica TaxID=470096 RepID=A0A6A6WBP5_9PEZI|nr:RNA-binding domain-containing protein [Pseudovirgaria hyperparasitica]KAF2760113.1 RNA-binding domain-containing protein [Pseudovirgaria hyperparasitica]